jgi:hypothetical protein
MELAQFAKKVYEYFAYRIYGKLLDWRQVNGPKSRNTIEEFANIVIQQHGSAAGSEFIWFYIVYQFGRFSITGFQPEGHVKFITPVQVFGKSAIEKFNARKSIDALTIRDSWMLEHKLSQQEFVKLSGYTFTADRSKIDRNKVEEKIMSFRDPIKKIVSTTNAGMDLCLEMTDMFNEKDPSCRKCPYSIECKAKLKEINPKLYKLRNYE